MSTTLNYIVEANIALLLFLVVYKVLFTKETHFRALRMILLAGIALSLTLPLIHLERPSAASALSIGHAVPSYWLPEVDLGSQEASVAGSSFQVWDYIAAVYILGCAIFFLQTVVQLRRLLKIIRTAKISWVGNLRVAESPEDLPVFSFCNFIVIGNAQNLSHEDRHHILLHEAIHARRWHSVDILLIHFLQIAFWFNPSINSYRKIFVQLHEFEADARAVESCDVNKYCNLLARAALQSADLRLAHYFNSSLTIKRIEMIRSIKRTIRHWKMAAMATSILLVFFFVACQDQVVQDMQEIAQNSSHALIVPEHVQSRFRQVQENSPDKRYVLLELNETASKKLDDLKKQFGVPNTIEILNTVDGKPSSTSIIGNASDVVLEESTTRNDSRRGNIQTFAIVEFTETASRLSDAAGHENKVYTVVEHQPEFPGGYDSLMGFLRKNIRYPSDARKAGYEGTVYLKFLVNVDGSVTDVSIIRGVSASIDAEAKRVVEMFPNWTPGRQAGQDVTVRFVIPVKFAL